MLKKKIQELFLQETNRGKKRFEVINETVAGQIFAGDCTSLSNCQTFEGSCPGLRTCSNYRQT